MKNLDKIITNILILTWVGLSCSILKADPSCGDGVCNGDESYVTCPDDCNIVITEIFILTADSMPQYLEFYNNSNSIVSLENWSIKILDGNGDKIFKSLIMVIPNDRFSSQTPLYTTIASFTSYFTNKIHTKIQNGDKISKSLVMVSTPQTPCSRNSAKLQDQQS